MKIKTIKDYFYQLNSTILYYNQKRKTMTRFETLDGIKLGVRFSGGRQRGEVFHLTPQEQHDLFNLPLSFTVVSDNLWSGTVEDLLNMFVKGTKSEKETFESRWQRPFSKSLHLEERTGLNDQGELNQFFVR